MGRVTEYANRWMGFMTVQIHPATGKSTILWLHQGWLLQNWLWLTLAPSSIGTQLHIALTLSLKKTNDPVKPRLAIRRDHGSFVRIIP